MSHNELVRVWNLLGRPRQARGTRHALRSTSGTSMCVCVECQADEYSTDHRDLFLSVGRQLVQYCLVKLTFVALQCRANV